MQQHISQFKLNVLTALATAFIAFVVGVIVFVTVGITTVISGHSTYEISGWFTAFMSVSICLIIASAGLFIGPEMAEEPVGSPERRASQRFFGLIRFLLAIFAVGFTWKLRNDEKAVYILLILVIIGLVVWLLKSGTLATLISMVFRRIGRILHLVVMSPFFLMEAAIFAAIGSVIIGLQTWVIYTIATLFYPFTGFSADALPVVSGIAPVILFMWCTFGAARKREYNMLGGYFYALEWVTVSIVFPISDFFDFITRLFDAIGNLAKSGINKLSNWLQKPAKMLEDLIVQNLKIGVIVN